MTFVVIRLLVDLDYGRDNQQFVCDRYGRDLHWPVSTFDINHLTNICSYAEFND